MSLQHGFTPLPHESPEVVLCASFSRHGTRLATGSGDHRIRVYDLNEKTDSWDLVESWRGHNAMILDVALSPSSGLPLLASSSSDLKLKLWAEHHTSPPLSGRRFRVIFSQSSPSSSPYTSLSFHAPAPPSIDLYLATTTRDGLLALLEPVDPNRGDDWKELDAFWIQGKQHPRGMESHFAVSFQDGASGPNWGALAAGLEENTLSLAVTAGTEARLFRVLSGGGYGGGTNGGGGYRFQAPAAVLTGAQSFVKDIAWASPGGRSKDLIAAASADGFVRIYEVWTPRGRTEGAVTNGDVLDGKRTRAESEQSALRHIPSGIGAGLAGARKDVEGGLEPGQVLHDWKCVAELRHEGAWKVEWIRNGTMVVSTGDNGRAVVWALAQNGKWMDFADFGPDHSSDEGK